jgi:hypothetical protein
MGYTRFSEGGCTRLAAKTLAGYYLLASLSKCLVVYPCSHTSEVWWWCLISTAWWVTRLVGKVCNLYTVYNWYISRAHGQEQPGPSHDLTKLNLWYNSVVHCSKFIYYLVIFLFHKYVIFVHGLVNRLLMFNYSLKCLPLYSPNLYLCLSLAYHLFFNILTEY